MVAKVIGILEKKNLKVKDVATILQVPDQKEFEKFLLSNGFTFSGMAKWLKAPQPVEA
jgi:phage antirepressor YoqD-like protein